MRCGHFNIPGNGNCGLVNVKLECNKFQSYFVMLWDGITCKKIVFFLILYCRQFFKYIYFLNKC